MKLDGAKRQILQTTLSVMHNGLVVLQREKERMGANILSARYIEPNDDNEFKRLCDNIERYEMEMDYIRSIL